MGLESTDYVFELMDSLTEAGYPTYIVGGAVRDMLLERPIKDLDVATAATPEELRQHIENNLQNFTYITGGEADKSINNLVSLVNFPNHKKGQPHDIEVATFRIDAGYEKDENGIPDRTRPLLKATKTLEEDVKRRDFTINAMAMDSSGNIIDLVNGQQDLENGVIRTVGKPSSRFAEDPVRMIRAVRFSTRYKFRMDSATRKAITDHLDWLDRISPERMRSELGQVLMNTHGFEELYDLGILPHIMIELEGIKTLRHNPKYHPEGTVYDHYVAMFNEYAGANRGLYEVPVNTQGYGKEDLLAWALLFHDIGKPMSAESSPKGDWFTFYEHELLGSTIFYDNYGSKAKDSPIHFSKNETMAITYTTKSHMAMFWDAKKFGKVTKLVADDNFELLTAVAYFDANHRPKGKYWDDRMEFLKGIRNEVEARAKAEPYPKGFGKMIADGLNLQGPEIGEAVNRIKDLVLSGKMPSYEAALQYEIDKMQG